MPDNRRVLVRQCCEVKGPVEGIHSFLRTFVVSHSDIFILVIETLDETCKSWKNKPLTISGLARFIAK